MVEFLKDIKGEGFTFQKGKRYVSLEDPLVHELKDSILVRQPNSPKGKNYWAKFPKNTDVLRIVDNTELSLTEMIEENKALSS
jgi:hypothetical protein